jgi:hypothetical protein
MKLLSSLLLFICRENRAIRAEPNYLSLPFATVGILAQDQAEARLSQLQNAYDATCETCVATEV